MTAPKRRRVSRRAFLGISVGAATASLLVACSPGAPPAPAPKTDAKPAAPAATAAPAKPAADAKPAAPAQPTAVAPAIKPGESSAPAAAKPTEAPSAAKPAADAKPAAGAPKRGGKIVVAQVADNANFEPFIQNPTMFPYLENLFMPIVRYDNELKPHPSVAESWQIAADGKSLTMKIRQGLKFATGREVTAEDVNFSVNRGKEAKVGALFRPQASLVTKTEAPDKYTAVWGWEGAFPGVVDLLARIFLVDKDGVDGQDWKGKGNGTGPFQWTEWQPGERSVFKKNANYYEKDVPLLDEVEVRSFGDSSSMGANLEAGAIDVASRLPMSEVSRLQGNPNLKVYRPPVRAVYDLLLQSVKPPFNNKTLRQAINWAIDRDRFVKTVLFGLSNPTYQPFPSHSWAHFPELEKAYSFDLDKAKALVAQAGYPNGLDITIMTSSGRARELRDLAQILAADLAKINVRAKIEDVEPAVYDPRHLGGEFELATHSYARANMDPSTLFRGAAAWHPGTGMTKFDDPEYRRLMEDAESSYNQEERKPKYKKLIEYIQDQSFVIPLAPNPEFYLHRNRVQGFISDGDANLTLKGVWLDG